MTKFELSYENGFSSILHIKDTKLPPTPWLLETQNGLKLGEITFNNVVISERGNYLVYNPQDPNFKLVIEKNNYVNTIPEYSFIHPKLYPSSSYLPESLEYELNLFLDRLDILELPSIFGFSYDPFNDPEFYFDELMKYGPSIIALRFNDIKNMNPSNLFTKLIEIRSLIPRNVALYLPNGVPIGYFAVFIALGIDIFDNGYAFRDTFRYLNYEDNFIRLANEKSYEEIVQNNLKEVIRDFKFAKKYLSENRLCEKIARDMHTSPKNASLIKYFFKKINFIEYKLKVSMNMTNPIAFCGDEGLYFPDVLSFQESLFENYRIRPEKRVLLIIPCSARKPYENSKTHKYYEETIKRSSKRKRNLIEVWSLTSPLGVVPRYVETVYPAKSYDIPVTGDWSDEEIRRTEGLLLKLLKNISQDISIIIHLSLSYSPIVKNLKSSSNVKISWLDEHPTSNNALQNLSKLIRENLELYEEIDLNDKWSYYDKKAKIQSIIQFTHGKESKIELNNVKIKGRPSISLQVQKENKHYMNWDVVNGKISLSLIAAQCIANKTKNYVITNTDKLEGSTLFAVGLIKASEKIHPNEEVLLFNEDRTVFLGIGISIVSGITMNNINGPIVKIKKKCEIYLGK